MARILIPSSFEEGRHYNLLFSKISATCVNCVTEKNLMVSYWFETCFHTFLQYSLMTSLLRGNLSLHEKIHTAILTPFMLMHRS